MIGSGVRAMGALAIANAVLGTPQVCNDGTTTCRAYSSTDNPLADVSFLGLEMLRFPRRWSNRPS